MEPLDDKETLKREAQAPTTGASVLVIEGTSARAVQLDRELVFGRAPGCEVELSDDGVSRRHARLGFHDGGWHVHDLQSHNGTFVNRQRVTSPTRLEAGDVIGLGDATIVVQSVGAPRRFERVVPWGRFTASLDEALAVALRTGAPLAVAAFVLSKPTSRQAALLKEFEQGLHPGDLGASASPTDFAVLLGDALDPLAASGRALGVLAQFDAEVRAGVALFPRDGTRAEVLLLAAREAARLAEPGQLAEHGDAAELSLGERHLVVADPATRRVYALLTSLGPSSVNVLINGETGVGKENAAYALHHYSRRRAGPFVPVNCAALVDGLAESELFGHERGAFTGATSTRIGVFEAAHGGTLFLDEVGELSAAVQAKLLRALETRTVTRVGGTKPIEVDVRLVSATHRSLDEDVATGRFRKDLYFRLAGTTVTLPALRSRPIELVLLARRFLQEACAREGRPPMQLSAEAMDAMQRYEWEGNVRELKNTLETVVATCPTVVVQREYLPPRISGETVASTPLSPDNGGARKPLSQELADLETRRIVEALIATSGSQTEAADLLGMPRRTLVFKLQRLRAHGLVPAGL